MDGVGPIVWDGVGSMMPMGSTDDGGGMEVDGEGLTDMVNMILLSW